MTAASWNVGDVKITSIIELHNVRHPNFVFRNLSQEEVLQQAWLRPHFATEDGRLISVTQAFVVECAGRRIIIDTCIGNGKSRKWPAWNKLDEPFLTELADAGYPAESIDTVLCTHLHVDHVGWNTRLVDGRWIPTFPNASYLFGRKEWEYWSAETDEKLNNDVSQEVASEVLETRTVYQDSVRPIIEAGLHKLVEMDHKLTDEISLEPTPGHTPGHVSVRISSRGQHAIITGDMMHHPIQCALPEASSNFDDNVAEASATRKEFLRCCADRPAIRAEGDREARGQHLRRLQNQVPQWKNLPCRVAWTRALRELLFLSGLRHQHAGYLQAHRSDAGARSPEPSQSAGAGGVQTHARLALTPVRGDD